MTQLLSRTVIASGSTQEVVTDGIPNYVIFVSDGRARAEIFLDGAASDGYGVTIERGEPQVVAASAKVVLTPISGAACTAEVYSA